MFVECAGCWASPPVAVGCWGCSRARHAQQAAYIGQIHQASRGTHDALRVHVELAARGLPCGHNRVARLMRQARLVGCHGRRPVHTTRRDPSAKPAPDLVQRTLTAPTPDQLWIADITYIPKEEEGFLYLGVILDVFTRRMVGWSMQEHLRTEHILEALEMAVRHRHPGGGLISSLGSRLPVYLAPVRQRCQDLGIQCSLGSVGDCLDNAMAESLFASLECELLAQHRFPTHDEARAAVFEWLEVLYNRQRQHSALGYLAPAAYEQTYTNRTPGVA